MKISHSRPNMAITTNGTPVDDLAILLSGNPGETARIQTVGTGPLTLSCALSSSIVPGYTEIRNTTLTPGIVITVTIGAYSTTGTVIQLPQGERLCQILLQAGLPSSSAMSLSIPTGLASGSYVDIGELWYSPINDFVTKKGWKVQEIDKSEGDMSEFSQQSDRRGQVRRELTFSIREMKQGDVYGSGDFLPMGFKELWARINRRQRAIYIPRWLDAAGAVSPSVIAASAIFGVAKQPPSITHVAGPWYDSSEILVDEIPIPV